MPWCSPAHPVFGDGQQAEGAVWAVLREQLPDDAALFYAVRLVEGARHQVIDLLVGWPGVGIATIEVAGGLGHHDTGELPATGPDTGLVEEARDERHMLHRILEARRSAAASARTVHMVALPHTPVDRDWDSPLLPRALVIDREDMAEAAKRIRAAIEDFGHDAGRDYGHGSRPLSRADLTSLVDLFGAQMPSQADALQYASDDDADRLGHLTRDQGKVIDVFEHYPRLTVTGGAGTGKTWLALELARRRAREGNRVALLCRSRGVSRYMQRLTERWQLRDRPAFVGVPEDLLRTWGGEASAEGADEATFWSEVLPERLYGVAVRRPDVDCFDSLFVDEAQEFGERWWPALVELLREPQTGTLVAFTDNGHSDAWQRAGAPIDVAPLELGENVRSSRQIARLTESFALQEFLARGRKRAGVRFVDVPAGYAPAVAEMALDTLRSEGWSPGGIAILATGEPWFEDAEPPEDHAAYWDRVLDGQDVHRGGVRDFQGLERPVVILIVNGFADVSHARELLYLGISRARTLLVVVGPGELIEEVGGERVRRRLRKAEAWSPHG